MSSVRVAALGSGGLPLPRAAVLLVVLFAGGLGLGQLGLDSLGNAAVAAFKAIAGAHYRLYLARENLNADGEAEFAVLVAEGARGALDGFVDGRPGWSARDALVPGWVVITSPAGTSGALGTLRREPFARAVLRNRGMWICH